MRADRVIPSTYDGQVHEVTSNTQIYQSVNQKCNEAPTLTPYQVKYSNLGSYNIVVRLCSEVPHELPKRQRPKPLNLLLGIG